MNYAAVAVGGFLGAIARFCVGEWFVDLVHSTGFPWGTLLINLLGSFVLAFFLTLTMKALLIHPLLRLGLSTGFLGAFTTFSTFSLESIQLIQNHQWTYAALYLFSSIVLCIAMSAFGLVAARGVEQYMASKPANQQITDETER